jgi:hypothetical protein
MALPGQASGEFTESSSALRILHVGHRNTFAAELTTDGFIQTNPPVITAAATLSTTLPVAPKRGVLGGSVAFTRPAAGNGLIGGPTGAASGANGAVRPLGLFINDAAGNAFENTPAPASGKAPYVCAQGTFGIRLYETQVLAPGGAGTTSGTAGDDLIYANGLKVYASVNGYLTTAVSAAGSESADVHEVAYADEAAIAGATVMGIVTIVPDSVHAELVIDQRV